MNRPAYGLGSGRRARSTRYGLTIAFLASCFFVAAAPAADLSFSQDVAPILQSKCLSCHGEGELMSQLDLRTREGMLRGGVRGPALVPGRAAESRVYQLISGKQAPAMPLGGALSADEISTLERWINEGASWDVARLDPQPKQPGHEQAPAAAVKPEKGAISEEDRNWWAFRKPLRRPVPLLKEARWNGNPVDAFLKKQLDEEGLEPAPRADRRTLIRRAYLDVVGLLPAPEEVEDFVNDSSEDAFAKLVDRLLASPHYGERWGRHWLDVARYADSGGYEHDYDYPHAWRYRDYVVRAFNDDKPYDQFIREQLAGDELDEVTNDSLIATGFNRVGPTVGFREKDNPQYRYNYLDDMIGTTGRAFMGMTVNCARCHDHKFDPILQHDYYSMLATFFPFVKYEFPLAPPEDVAEFEARKAEIDAEIKPLNAKITGLEAPYRKLAFEKKLESFPEEIQLAVRTPDAERTPGQKLLADQVTTIEVSVDTVADRIEPEDRAAMDALKAQIEELKKRMPPELPRAMAVRDGDYRFAPDGLGDEKLPGKGEREDYGEIAGTFLPQAGKPFVPPTAYLLPSGDHRVKGDPVEPGFPRVLTRGDEPTAVPPSGENISSGRRRALAEWIASPDHPLTARVMVNRLWHFHFGRGIVATTSNFGRTGEPPLYPELLDWLATEFVRRGWSIKSMHRLLMTSEAYQMASAFDHPGNREKDPSGQHPWRFPERRLEAEVIRDIVLDASGKLNREVGGEPFFPPIPEALRLSFPKGKWEMTEQGPAVWRRSIYSYWKRGLRYPMFEVFDQPDPNVTCERRNRTTVPTQALTLLNNEFVLEQAKYFAERVAREAGGDAEARIRQAYQIALSRGPDHDEFDRNLGFLKKQTEYHRARGEDDPDGAALVDLCDVIFNLSEFVYVN